MDCKVECECDESIKKYWDNIWLNPKYYKKWTTSSQASNSTKWLEEGSTTMDVKSSRMQVIGIRSGAPLTGDAEGDDIVYALMKIRGRYYATAQG